jgi:hypothetical protein
MMDRGLPAPPGLLPRLPLPETEEKRHASPRWVTRLLWLFFIAVWVGLGVFALVSPDATGQIMTWIGEQATVVQLVVWIAFLPVVAAVAIWESTLDLWIRVVALMACLFWTTFGLYPRKDDAS